MIALNMVGSVGSTEPGGENFMTLGAHRKGARVGLAAAIAAAAMGLIACGSSDDNGSTASTGSSAAASTTSGGGSTTSSSSGGKKASIAAFIVDSANPYDASLSKAIKAEAAKQGADLEIFGADNDPQKQVGQCDDALATQKYNVFLIKAVSGPPMMPCARQAIAKGDTVIAIDDPLGPEYTTKPQVDGVAASILSLPTTNGTALAEMTNEACADKNPCKVAYYYGPPAFVFASQSRQSFLDTVKQKFPNIQVVDSASSNFDLGTAYTLTKSLLAKDPDVNVITADADQSASGSIKALKETNKLGSVKVIGGGGSSVGATNIKAGDEFGTSALYPQSLGTKGVDLGIKALNGQPLGKTEYDVAYLTPLGPKITKANVAQFKPEW
jgi:ribose transport system substrate-binding protein